MSQEVIIKLIKNEEFLSLSQNVEDYLKAVKSVKQLEEVFGLISHFIYNQDAILKENLSHITNFIMPLLKASKFKTSNCTQILKSLYYILCLGVRKGLNIQNTLGLASEMELFIHSSEDFYLNHPELVKKMYYTLWNYSLEKGISPLNALSLQGQALSFMSLVSDNIIEVCNNIKKVGKLAENSSCSSENIDLMYKKVFKSFVLYLKSKTSIQNSSVLAFSQILIEYAQNVLNSTTYSEFSKLFKPLTAALEPVSDPKVILSFKISIKTVEASMAFINGKCKEDVLLNILKACNVISMSSPSNTILINGLLSAHHLLQNNRDSKVSTSVDISHAVFSKIIERISKCNTLEIDSLLKILEETGKYLNELFVKVVNNGPETESYFEKGNYFAAILPDVLSTVWHLRGETQVYNLGISCCNLGVVAFKAKKYSFAADYLDSGIKYLNANCESCDEVQKEKIISIMKKKAVLLKDSLRYQGDHKEAMIKTFYLFFLKLIPVSELVPTWIKCKRDDYKVNSSLLKKLCIKDIFLEAKSRYDLENTPRIEIEELVLDEFKELQMLNYNSAEDQLSCSRSLMNSEDHRYTLEGLLIQAKVYWVYPESVSDGTTISKIVNDALHYIEKYSKVYKYSYLMEYRAMCSLWIYLCNLQSIQKSTEAELEENRKNEEPLTVQSTDMGEEVQPHDTCSIRPSSITTFDTQSKALEHVHNALHYWSLVKIDDVKRPAAMCTDLLSIGFIFKLRGILPPCIKALALLLKVASIHDLSQFWISGMSELLEIVPELISIKVANSLEDLLNTESKSNLPEHVRMSTLSSLAHYYFRKGEFSAGAKIALECMKSPLMEKRTTLATEAQIGVYLIASYFSSLPKSILPESLRPDGTCLILALNATRKAIGLINVAINGNYHGNLCWHHKVAWLHHITCLWLGHLCQITAQPRVARAYLRQALTLSEKLALPLRTIELLCKLSEVDLQCEQLDDCRVKIDSISYLLRVHASNSPNDDVLNLDANFKKKLKEKSCSSVQVQNLHNSYIPIHVDVDENMRDSQASPDFELKTPSKKLGNQLLVIGNEKKIGNFAQLAMNVYPSSPTVLYGEENMVKKDILCPKKIKDCDICSTPELLVISIKINIIMGIIQAHRNKKKSAHLCFTQAQEDLEKLSGNSSEIISNLCSVISNFSLKECEVLNDKVAERELFISTHIDMVELSLLFNYNEVICMEKNYEKMSALISQNEKRMSDVNFIVLVTNHHLVVQLILQCHAITRALSKCKNEDAEDRLAELDELESSPVHLNSKKKIDFINLFKTPARSTHKSKVSSELPAVESSAKHQIPKTFNIFSDEEDSPFIVKNSSKTIASSKGRKVKALTSSFEKLKLDSGNANGDSVSKQNAHTSPAFPSLCFKESPFSKVFNLPDAKGFEKDKKGGTSSSEVKTEENKPLKGNRKLRKLITTSSTKNIDLKCVQKKEKENSPIIKADSKPLARATRARKCDKSEGSNTQDCVRETRSKRNFKRL